MAGPSNPSQSSSPGASRLAERAPRLPRLSIRSGENELLPQPRFAGPTPWVMAIMVTLTVIAAAAGLALHNLAATARAELAGGITVQILEARPEARDQQARAAVALLNASPGVSSVRLVPDSEINALIAPWLGEDRDGSDAVPVPALIDARLDGPAEPPRIAELQAMLRTRAPAARIEAQAGWLRPVFGAIASLEWLALALVGLLAGAMTAAAVLATRTALGTHHETIEIVHMLGGTDVQIARIFQRTIGLDAMMGGALGLSLALATVELLSRSFAELGAGLLTGGALGWSDWLLLALVPVAGVAIAMTTARYSVLAALRKML